MSRFENWIIPDSWAWAVMEELGEVIAGGTPSTKEPEYWGGKINWISPSDLSGYSSKFISHGAKSLSEKGLLNSSAKMMPAGSIHFSSRAPIGYVVISANPMTTNQGFKSLIPGQGVFNEFVYYYLKSAKKTAEDMASGTTFKELSGTVFGQLPVPLPPLNEQKRIVAKIEELFSELDKGIESLKTAREQLKVYRQALLKYAFEGKLTAQWREENKDKLETADALLRRIQAEREQRYQQQLKEWQKALKKWEASGKKDRKPPKPSQPKHLPPLTPEELADLPQLPEGWAWVRSGELFEFVTSGSRGWAAHYSDVGALFIRITNMDFDSLVLDLRADKVQHVNPPEGAEGFRTRVKKGDFLFSITGFLGMFAIAPELEDAYVNQHIALARPLSGFEKKYVGYYVTSQSGGIHYLNRLTKGAVKAGLGLDDIRSFPVPMCSIAEQNAIIEVLEARLSMIAELGTTIDNALQQSEVLRQSILKKAFSGQLVPQDPNDEPASVLLERIRAEKSSKTGTVAPKCPQKTSRPVRRVK